MTCKTLRATMPAKCCASRHCAVRRIAATGDAVPLFDTCASCATGESVLAQLVQAGWTPPTATRTAGR